MSTNHRRSKERDEIGASAIEYGLLISGVAAMIVVIVFVFGQAIAGSILDTCDQVATANGSTC
jgi:pilus assembly protein Flp/PilA